MFICGQLHIAYSLSHCVHTVGVNPALERLGDGSHFV